MSSSPVVDADIGGDIDEARSVAGALYYPHHVTPLAGVHRFRMRVRAASVGPVVLGWLSYANEVEVRTGPLDSAYQVNAVLAGRLRTASGEEEVLAAPGTAALYRPDRDTVMHGWNEPCPMVAVKIPHTALEHELSEQLGRSVPGPIAFRTALDLRSDAGRQWSALLQTLADHVTDADALARHPMIAPHLARSLLAGLLIVADHPYRAELDAPVRAAHPPAVAQALTFIEESTEPVLTVADVAAHAGVGVRALQQGFRRTLGTSPTRYVREVRLRRAHQDLLAADPAVTGVAEIALRWGFAHLGRFAERYRQAYGVPPSDTLRQPR
ncbi:AraC family transcriptional regulator (plasmid) [Pseudonocardia bannensis]|uniref:AraC family transcriptional regulator n=1 Tax=Pseudonocardia bannensis TaxID=630973 RepID=A0A848DPI0_9PSEU|nr:AraC family transcriptional regulator [Pseudonocardia bannensis]NMH94346.1 AraC family transcriptional regulator [Pseudonocardia bannensis]